MNNSGSYGMEHLVEWYVEMVQHDKEILGTGEDTKQTEIIWSLSRSGMFAFTSVWTELVDHVMISRNLTALCCDRSLILEIINYFIISMIKFIVIVVSCLFTELE